MVVAKTDRAHKALSDSLRRPRPDRRSRTRLSGAGLGRAAHGRRERSTRRSAAPPTACAAPWCRRARRRPPCRSPISPCRSASASSQQEFAIASLVECRLETGRTHQIRVHMAHIGHPRDRRPRLRPGLSHQGQPAARTAEGPVQGISAPGAACLAPCISPPDYPSIDAGSRRRYRGTWRNSSAAFASSEPVSENLSGIVHFGVTHCFVLNNMPVFSRFCSCIIGCRGRAFWRSRHMPAAFRGHTPVERGRYHGPVITQYRFRRRRPQPLSGRNPPLSHAAAAGRVHARQALRGA